MQLLKFKIEATQRFDQRLSQGLVIFPRNLSETNAVKRGRCLNPRSKTLPCCFLALVMLYAVIYVPK